MTDINKNLVLRVLSAAVLLPAVLVVLWLGVWPTAILTAIICAGLAWEYYSIIFPKQDPGQLLGIASAAVIPLVLTAWPANLAFWGLGAAAFLLMALSTYYLIAGPLPQAPTRVSLVFTGVFYCGLLLSGICGLRKMPQGEYWILLALAVTVLNDTAAYAAGRTLGKHKLYPQVSPGKTWEGAIGGAVGSIAGALLIKAICFHSLTLGDCFLVGIPASVLGPIGDLTESMLKRAYGVKDSGHLIPGHGGLLDRLDALMFNVPYLYFYAVLAHGY